MNIDDGTVLLRAIEESDMDFCREMFNNPGIETSTVGKNFPVSAAQQMAWFREQKAEHTLRWVIDVKQTGPIGMVSMTEIDWINRTAEVGVKMVHSRSHTAQNTEDTAKGLIQYAFDELNLNCLYAQVLDDNLLSRKLMRHLRFHEDGILRARVYKRGRYHDLVQYSLLADEYRTW